MQKLATKFEGIPTKDEETPTEDKEIPDNQFATNRLLLWLKPFFFFDLGLLFSPIKQYIFSIRTASSKYYY